MTTDELLTVAAEALEAEGVSLTGADMPLDALDLISRWSLVVALEKEANRRAPDARIEEAATVGDLIALYAKDDDEGASAGSAGGSAEGSDAATGPLSADDIRAALGL